MDLSFSDTSFPKVLYSIWCSSAYGFTGCKIYVDFYNQVAKGEEAHAKDRAAGFTEISTVLDLLKHHQQQFLYLHTLKCIYPRKNTWEFKMKSTVFTPSLEGMKLVKSDDGEMLTKPFLDVCKQVLPVIDKFGPVMALAKSDIGGNISRLESAYSSNPSEFNHLYSMVKASSSCASGLLWLTRAMDFLVELFHNLLEHPDWTMSKVCTDSYTKTLKKFHGWIARSSFSLAMKLVPDRRKFMQVIGGSGDINADIAKFCTTFSPLLRENHKFLASLGVDDLKAY